MVRIFDQKLLGNIVNEIIKQEDETFSIDFKLVEAFEDDNPEFGKHKAIKLKLSENLGKIINEVKNDSNKDEIEIFKQLYEKYKDTL